MKETIDKFLEALKLTGIFLDRDRITIDDLGCPHVPKGLPHGKMAIYTFQKDGKYLKIGKAGANSNARFKSQHYRSHLAKSNLAKSLLNDPDMAVNKLNESDVNEWIRNNTRRIDILIDSTTDIFILNFLEAFLHCKFEPKYEGFETQRVIVNTE
jgi:hypothetical protein